MRTLSNSRSGTGESARADARLSASGLQGPATEDVLISSHSSAHTARAVAALEAGFRRLPAVKSAAGPDRVPSQSTAGGRTALVVVTLRGDPNSPDGRAAQVQQFVDRMASEQSGVTLREAGSGSEDNAITKLVNDGLHRVELISLPITLLILVLAFGALVAASVPLLLGLTSVAAALGALGLVSHIAPNGSSTAPVVVLIGLAVGVDYSLFYIRRERAERRTGASADAALDATSATVGRAIVVAGTTVVIGLAGLLFTGLRSVHLDGAGSDPGRRDRGRRLADRAPRDARAARRPGRPRPALARVVAGTGTRGRRTMWQVLAAGVTSRPRLSLAIAVILLAVLAAPVIGIQTGEPGQNDVAPNTPIRVAERAIERAFPGSSDTADLVVSGHGLKRASTRAALRRVGGEGRRSRTAGARWRCRCRATARRPSCRSRSRRAVSASATSASSSATAPTRAGGRTAIPGRACGADRRRCRQPRLFEPPVARHPAGDRVRARARVRAAGRDVRLAIARRCR